MKTTFNRRQWLKCLGIATGAGLVCNRGIGGLIQTAFGQAASNKGRWVHLNTAGGTSPLQLFGSVMNGYKGVNSSHFTTLSNGMSMGSALANALTPEVLEHCLVLGVNMEQRRGNHAQGIHSLYTNNLTEGNHAMKLAYLMDGNQAKVGGIHLDGGMQGLSFAHPDMAPIEMFTTARPLIDHLKGTQIGGSGGSLPEIDKDHKAKAMDAILKMNQGAFAKNASSLDQMRGGIEALIKQLQINPPAFSGDPNDIPGLYGSSADRSYENTGNQAPALAISELAWHSGYRGMVIDNSTSFCDDHDNGLKYQLDTWVSSIIPGVATFTSRMFQTFQANPNLRDLLIIGGEMGGAHIQGHSDTVTHLLISPKVKSAQIAKLLEQNNGEFGFDFSDPSRQPLTVKEYWATIAYVLGIEGEPFGPVPARVQPYLLS